MSQAHGGQDFYVAYVANCRSLKSLPMWNLERGGFRERTLPSSIISYVTKADTSSLYYGCGWGVGVRYNIYYDE